MSVLSNLALVAVTLIFSTAHAAGLNDVQVVPHLDQKGKAAYQDFLHAKNPRAFAIAPGGSWGWRGGEVTIDAAVDGATQTCQLGTEQPCVLYALDDKIVFDARAWNRLWGPYQNQDETSESPVGKARGDRFFDLSLKNPVGKLTKLSDLRGKVVLLHFWGSWCRPCLKELPELQRLYQALAKEKDIQLVLVPVREEMAIARAWMEKSRFTMPLYDPVLQGANMDQLTLATGKPIHDRYLAKAFPTTYVLDKHGIVLFSSTGPVEGWLQYISFLKDAAARSGK
ncbi:MAG: TlpA disulfide reductase family protein [Sulfuricellaceae bacterium]|nr:TlpA disulfide reductase family protein [Sulfuricellaceae bacterium]